jgi:PAS domain S-box-containing protein
MTTRLRKTGIDIVGAVPWGTHFCHFYETGRDLLDILIPYFKAGLENNELCVWVVFDPIGEEEARDAIRQSVAYADRHLEAGDIEIVPHSEWYLKDGAFDLERVIKGWQEKLEVALARGYAGLRVNGNERRLTKDGWKDFAEYEKKLDETTANRQMIVLCTYPLAVSRAGEIFDVARMHQFVIARRNGNWETLETPVLKRARAEIKRLNKELDQRVVKRTRELAATNEELRKEIAERKRVEEKLRRSERQLAEAQCLTRIGSWNWDIQRNVLTWSDELYRMFGLHPQEFAAQKVFLESIHPEDRVLRSEIIESSLRNLEPFSYYFRVLLPDGRERIIYSRGNVVGDEQGNPIRMFGTAQDVTERRLAEERLKSSNEKLCALSARIQSAREEEGARIARELHDELGSVLTSLRWDLEGIVRLCNEPNQADSSNLREKIENMIGLIDATINTVRRISSELRPEILDDLGLLAAIEWQAQQFEARTGIICHLDSSVENIDLSPEQATAIFRIFQEAMTNILRHAQATRVDISVEAEDGEFVLEVRDNGKGIEEEERTGSRSLGLIGMRERAHLVGGRIEIAGVAGEGTVLAVRVPINIHA